MDWAGGDIHYQTNPSFEEAQKHVLANIGPLKPAIIIKSSNETCIKNGLNVQPPKKLDHVATYVYGEEIVNKEF